MSKSVSALENFVWSDGLVEVRDIGPQGMITLRGDHAARAVLAAVSAFGCEMPAPRQISESGARSVGWMSPDELLLMCPYAEVATVIAELKSALGDTHSLVVDVSDARALFQVSGAAVRDVLSKLTPVNLSPIATPAGRLHRTRMAQVPAAFWLADDATAHVICFRSVAQYVFDLLKVAGAQGSAVGYHDQ